MDEQPSSLTGNADVTGSMGIASSVMSAGSTVRNVRPSTITKPRNRASVVGGDHKMTHKDLHSVFMPSSRDLAVTTDEQVARVQLVHEKFSEGAEFSFNYNTMLLVASILAGLGLASNSTATIIASMLVSPIMGPVVGMVRSPYHDARRKNWNPLLEQNAFGGPS